MVVVRRILTGLMILAAALVALPISADGKAPFEVADRNNDGRVSIEEAKKAGVPESTAKDNDLNGDGELTRADWRFIDVSGDNGG